MKKRKAFFSKNYQATKESITKAKEYHDAAHKLLNALTINRNINDAKQMLLNYNLGACIGTEITKVAILVDATESMSSLLQATKNTISEMFSRISIILKENKMDPKQFQIQFAAYRNYNAPESELLKYSGWCDDPLLLNRFLNDVPPAYGIGNEAVEVALQYINDDPDINEIIIIGDVPPNTKKEVEAARSQYHGGESYWATTRFANITNYEIEMNKLKQKEIKVNCFYLTEYAKPVFVQMASSTQGISAFLDIHSSKGAQMLTELVSVRVLMAVGGDKLVKAYEGKFHI